MGVILKPVITEKMTAKAEKLNQYGFMSIKGQIKFRLKVKLKSFTVLKYFL